MIQKIRTVCSNGDTLAGKKQDLHFCLSCCGSSGVTSFGSLVGLGFMDFLKDSAEYVMGTVYSPNRGERLNIDKSHRYV